MKPNYVRCALSSAEQAVQCAILVHDASEIQPDMLALATQSSGKQVPSSDCVGLGYILW